MDVISTSTEVSEKKKKKDPFICLYDLKDKNQWLTAALLWQNNDTEYSFLFTFNVSQLPANREHLQLLRLREDVVVALMTNLPLIGPFYFQNQIGNNMLNIIYIHFSLSCQSSFAGVKNHISALSSRPATQQMPRRNRSTQNFLYPAFSDTHPVWLSVWFKKKK